MELHGVDSKPAAFSLAELFERHAGFPTWGGALLESHGLIFYSVGVFSLLAELVERSRVNSHLGLG